MADMGSYFLRQCWILAEINSFRILAEMNSFWNTVYNSLYFELPAVPAYTEKGVNRAIFYISWLSKILQSNAFTIFNQMDTNLWRFQNLNVSITVYYIIIT